MARVLEVRPPVLRESTGERIRRLRLASDRSIRQLAADAGVCHTVVQRAENDHNVYLHNFVAIAEVLNVDLQYLWDGREP